MWRLADLVERGLSSWMSARGLNSHAEVSEENVADAIAVAANIFQRSGRKFLHVGCGPARKPDVAACFLSDDWQEIRLDIDPAVDPEFVCSMLDMSPVPDASVDAVYSSHNIEHLYPHEVPRAFSEFYRVLRPDGLLILTCPDIKAVCELVAEDKLTDTAYTAPVGPIAPLDILFGHRPQLAAGNLFMAHHTGFTLRTLVDEARSAGFRSVAGRQRRASLDLWMVATKALLPEDEIRRLSETHLPL